MRVLFADSVSNQNPDPLSTPMALLSIATYLKHHGHTVKIFESGKNTKYKFKNIIKEFSPDIIGISLMTGNAIDDTIALSKIAKTAELTVVWGGFFPSSFPELSLKTGSVDIVSIGEGEHTWLDLLDAIETQRPLDTVKGLAFIKDGQIITTPQRDFADLSEFPALDWDLIDVNNCFYSYYYCKKTLYLYSSKGCPGQCTYCYNHNFHKSLRRTRPPEIIVKEITELVNKYGADGISFIDDLTFCNKEEVYNFCSKIKEANLNFVWGGYGKTGLLDKEDFQYMYDSGCRWMFFGVESGNKEILKEIKKGVNFDTIEKTFIDCADVGIITRGAFILGFPGETEEALRDTIELALKLKSSQVLINYYSLIPKSEAYLKMLSEGRFVQPESLQDFAKNFATFDTPTKNFSNIPDKDLKVVYSYFFIRKFLAKDFTNVDKINSWSAITLNILLKTLQESSIEKFFLSINRFTKILFYALCQPKTRKKYGLNLNLLKNNKRKNT